MVDRIRWDTVSYLPFYYVFFQFLLLTIFNLQANILTTKDILSNLGYYLRIPLYTLNNTNLNPTFLCLIKYRKDFCCMLPEKGLRPVWMGLSPSFPRYMQAADARGADGPFCRGTRGGGGGWGVEQTGFASDEKKTHNLFMLLEGRQQKQL